MTRTFSYIKAICLIMIAIAVFGCSSTKEVSQAEIDKHHAVVMQVEDRNFLVKADKIVMAKHTFHSITPTTNFIMVDGDKATVQISVGKGVGQNGIGGFTVQGTVSGWEFNERANGDVKVKFNVNALSGSCTVFVNIPKNSTTAIVTVNNTFRGHNATMYGDVSAIDHSVFVGKTNI